MIWLCIFCFFATGTEVRIPINSSHIELTEIGEFGLLRKARPNIPAHLHTGIDIKRPGNNYDHEPIFPIADGIVISKRTDGPYAQLIIEHPNNGEPFWTVYEHIAEIQVHLSQQVNPETQIARFFNREELNLHGWQFDHFHFEILKKQPLKITPSAKTPERHFRSYTLSCFTEEELLQNFYDPYLFLYKNTKP